ncbi:MAG: hypothetical protein ABI910_03870 [Gemmatimonadota bacterium]
MPQADASYLGALMLLLEIATAYAGSLYGVNAFDQRGVELGKRYTYGMMGRPCVAAVRDELAKLPQSNPARAIGECECDALAA